MSKRKEWAEMSAQDKDRVILSLTDRVAELERQLRAVRESANYLYRTTEERLS
jgi:predicted Fe-S protein YdhL (DUF1289 family)